MGEFVTYEDAETFEKRVHNDSDVAKKVLEDLGMPGHEQVSQLLAQADYYWSAVPALQTPTKTTVTSEDEDFSRFA